MSNFISIQDYDASIHREILDSLLRSKGAGGQPNPSYNPQIIETCENRSIAEMRSALSSRYDCDAIFSASGDGRHELILMYALDIAIYHIFCQHNPYKMADIRKDRYDEAKRWLTDVRDGKERIEGAPLLPDANAEGKAPWQISADTLRPTML